MEIIADARNSLFFWVGFLGYSLLVTGIGLLVWLKEKRNGEAQDNKTYWAAGKRLDGWSVGLSISASMMSISWSCVYGVQLFYWYGTGGMWLLIIPWLFTMAGFYAFAPLFRTLNAFSQPELLEKRFGPLARQMLAPALVIVFITWTGAEIYAAGNIIAPFLGISVPATLFLIALVVAIYSFTGGFEAVVSTDKIQFILVAFFISVIAWLGVRQLPDHVDVLRFLTPPAGAPKATGDSNWFSPGWAVIMLTFFAYLPGWLIETDVWIRLQAAKDDRQARRGVLIAGINSAVFVGLMPLMIGLAALYLYPPVDGVIPERLQDGALIFTVIMQDYAPVWLSVILSVGLIAAAMSTVDTCGNVVALSLSSDLLEPFLRNRMTPAGLNRLARWMSVAAIMISFVYALFTESLWDIFYLSSGILTTTVFLPVIATFLPGTKSRQVYFSMSAGLFSTILFYFLESREMLATIEPSFIADTGIGYILWGFLFSVAGYLAGKLKSSK